MIVQIVGDLFGWAMYGCYNLTHNYGITILLFTLLTKILLLPVSVMVQKNSIKMVKMYPQINRIKAKYFGDKDMISEEQYHLYKKERYHPMLDLLPVILQLVILMGVIDVIYKPLRHLLRMDQACIDNVLRVFSALTGIGRGVASAQIQLVGYLSGTGKAEAFFSVLPDDVLSQMMSLKLLFCGIDLGAIPISERGISVLIPVLAALSSWFMCFTQNRANVLQSEQSRVNKMATLLLSVALSLYLGFFVPAGVGFYWILSNLMSIAVMYLLNHFIAPEKYIDYRALEESRQELEQMRRYSAASKSGKEKEYAVLERKDYKRFCRYENKQIVFYSEKNGFYKYFQNIIEMILKKTDIIIHYITSDPGDEVFRLQSENFQVYYIGESKLIILMMKMDADIVVMTMPDLQKYHIKRSMLRNDIEYIYIDHGIGSLNLMLRKHAVDNFDTIFASNEIVYQEIRRQEEVYSLKEKTIVKYGYGLIDHMIAEYEKQEQKENDPKIILIAPSWQEDNIMDLCLEEILDRLLGQGYRIILRPHPQYVKHFGEKLRMLDAQYSKYPEFTLQTDFSSNDTVFNADVLLTDWSGIAYEYSFTTLKPVLFIDTPMKMMNPDYEEIGVVPFDKMIRGQIGIALDPGKLDGICQVVGRLLREEEYCRDSLRELRDKYLYNVSKSAEVGAGYIIRRLIEYSKK